MLDTKGCRGQLMNIAQRLLSIDSPSGFTDQVVREAEQIARDHGYAVRRTNKGNLVVSVPGREKGKRVGLCAHIDTLGLMVRSITADGMLMTTRIGGPILPTLDGDDARIDEAAAEAMVDRAMAAGVNYFDTAWGYHAGNSERVMGRALAKYPRESFYLADKFPGYDLANMDKVEEIFEAQLQKCGVKYFDFYLFHNVCEMNIDAYLDPRYGIHDYLMEQKRAGRIRHLGFSAHGSIPVMERFLNAYGEHMEFCQIQLNYLDWKHASGRNVNADYLYGELEKRGIPAVIMEPLLGGRLSNVPDHIVARLKQQRPENSVASWAFRFAGSPDGVLTVLSGMTYMEHLQDNIRTYSPLIPVTDEEKDFLEETAQLMMKYPTIPCNDCKYCMPCPYALDIPGILLHYNKCVNEGNVPKSAQDENYAKARRAFLVGYDRSVPKLRQANHCTGCEQCNPHCPQGIDIPKEMQRIDKFVEELKVNG